MIEEKQKDILTDLSMTTTGENDTVTELYGFW